VCRDAHRLIARADARYAAGQAVTRAMANKSEPNSDKSYEEAAHGYREAIAKLEAAGTSPLLAEAQLAAATLLDVDVDGFTEARTWAAKAAETYSSLGDDYGKSRARAIGGAAEFDVAVSVKKSGTTDAAKQADTMLADARDRLDSVVGFHVGRRQFYDAAWAQTVIGLNILLSGSLRRGDSRVSEGIAAV